MIVTDKDNDNASRSLSKRQAIKMIAIDKDNDNASRSLSKRQAIKMIAIDKDNDNIETKTAKVSKSDFPIDKRRSLPKIARNQR